MFTCYVIKRTLLHVGNVIYHKFADCDISYGFNGKNVNVMLELNHDMVKSKTMIC